MKGKCVTMLTVTDNDLKAVHHAITVEGATDVMIAASGSLEIWAGDEIWVWHVDGCTSNKILSAIRERVLRNHAGVTYQLSDDDHQWLTTIRFDVYEYLAKAEEFKGGN